jgi:hypothetical protein
MDGRIQLFPGVTVSKSIADWVRLMPWGDFTDNIELDRVIYENANQILDYLEFSDDEIDGFLREFNGDSFYGADAVIRAFDAAESLGLVDDYPGTPQEIKTIFRAIAHCTHKGVIQTYLPKGNSNFEHMSEIMVDHLSGDTKSLIPTITLNQIVLENEGFLPSHQIGPEIKLGLGYTIHKN